MDTKTKPMYMLPPRVPSQIERITQTLSKRWEKIFHANGKEEKAEEVICIFDKIDFKTKAIVIKGKIQQGDMTLVNTYTPNIGVPTM